MGDGEIDARLFDTLPAPTHGRGLGQPVVPGMGRTRDESESEGQSARGRKTTTV